MNKSSPLLAILLLVSFLWIGVGRADEKDDYIATFAAANKLQAAGKLKEAAALFEKTLQLAVKVYGENHLATAGTLNNLANVYQAQRRFAEAETLFRRCLAIYEKIHGPEHADVAFVLNTLGVLCKEQRKFADALALYERSLAIYQKADAKDSANVAIVLDNLGNVRLNQGNYSAAESLYKRSLAIREKVFGKVHLTVADTLTGVGIACIRQGKYAEAELLFQRSLEIREALYGKEHPEVARSCHNLGSVYIEMAKYAKSEPLLIRSLAIREKAFGKVHPLVMDTLGSLANLYNHMGKYPDAEALYRRTLAIGEKVYGADHLAIAAPLVNFADLYVGRGRYAEAEPLFERNLRIVEKAYGSEHPSVAFSLGGLANLYKHQGKFAEAELALLRSLGIYEKIQGAENRDVAQLLGALATLYRMQGKNDKAEPLYLRSLAMREKIHGQNHPDVATALSNLANHYAHQNKFSEAELLHKRSIAIYEKIRGKEHPDVARSLANLAVMYHGQKRSAEAEALYRRSLAIYEKVLGKEHPEVTGTLNNLSIMYSAQGRFADAARVNMQIRQSMRQFLLRELPSMSVREQTNFLQIHERARFAAALHMGYTLSSDRAILDASAAWLLNGKATTLEAQTIRSRLEREVVDADGQAALREIQAIRAQEAALALKTKQPEEAGKQRQLLEAKRRDLEKQLAQRSRTAATLVNPWTELADIRRKIPADGVLIDIARFPVRQKDVKKGEKASFIPRYVAWLIPPTGKGEVRIVDLGDAATVDAAILAARQTLESTPDRLDKRDSERKLEADLAEKLDAVAKLVFEPLKPNLGDAKKLIISPDGDLWLLPWAALPTAKDHYLVEDYSLRFVVTGRDLADSAVGQKPEMTAALILADPNYNLTPAEVAAAAPKQPSVPETVLVAQTRGSSDDLRGIGRVKRLPGTAAEAKQAFDRLKTLTGQEPKLYLEGEASETVVKATKSPRLLVLATHGFFMKKQEVELKDDKDELAPIGGEKPPLVVKDKDGKELENPLLRCGLLLAGANKRAEANPGQDDGILTGLEIVGLDLRGTQMVVLSACETGIGEVQTGEGVAGLRQAFQLAGAESVLATLWQISDSATSQLMNNFYDELAKGTERAEALTRAQRQFISARRERSGAAHPFFWASFTLTGNSEIVARIGARTEPKATVPAKDVAKDGPKSEPKTTVPAKDVAKDGPRIEPKMADPKPMEKPAPSSQPIGEIKMRSIAAGVGRSPACLCWSDDAKAFYHLAFNGTIRRMRYPELTEEAASAIGRKSSWISMSSEGLVATVRLTHEAYLLDAKTLKEIKKIPFEMGQYVVSSPKLAFAYAVDKSPEGGALTVLDLKTGKAVKQYSASDLGENVGLDHPVISADGQYLFATGSGKIFRYKLDGAEVKLADATDEIIKGRFEGLSISNEGDFVCAPCGGGNVGAGAYSTFIYASSNLKKPVLTIASGFFPLAIGFDNKSGLIYAQNLESALIVFDTKGVKRAEIPKDKVGGGPEVCQYLVHSGGRRVLFLNNPSAIAKGQQGKIFVAEMPANGTTVPAMKDMGAPAPKEPPVADPALSRAITEFNAAFDEGMALEKAQKYTEAAALYEKSLLIAPKAYEEYHPNTAAAVLSLAKTYWRLGRYAEAEPLFRRGVLIYEKLHGKEHVLVADALNGLALAIEYQGKYANAEPLYLRSLDIREKTLGKDHLDVAVSLNNLGILYKNQSRYLESEPLLERSLAIKEKVRGKDHPDVASALNVLGNLRKLQGKYAEAKLLYERSLAMVEKNLGVEHPDVMQTLNNLAVLYLEQGKYADAEPMFLRCATINEKVFGKDHPTVAKNLANLAIVYENQRKYADAERIYKRCLAIRENAFGKEHVEVANSLENLAHLYQRQRKFAEAESLHQRSLDILEKIQGSDHPNFARVLNNLGNLRVAQGKYGEAIPIIERSLAIREKAFGKKHLDVASAHDSLGNLYQHQGNYASAEYHFKFSLIYWEKVLGADHPSVAGTLYYLATLCADQGKFAEASRYLTRMRQSSRQFLLRELPSLTASEQQDFLKFTDTQRFAAALSLGYQASRTPNPSLPMKKAFTAKGQTVRWHLQQESAEWLVNGKAIAIEAQTIRSRLERETADDKGKAILGEIQTIRAQEAALAVRAKQSEAAIEERERLETRRRNLEKQLASGGAAAAKLADPWVELNYVRSHIPTDAVFIDIVRLATYKFGAKIGEKRWALPRYVAWVIPPNGAVSIVDLGDAALIDRAVQAARQTLENTPDRLEKRESETKLEADAAGKLEEVAKLVLRPLKLRLGKATKLIISPDGDLWLLPWAALPVGENRYLIEDYSLRFVVTGRDLMDYSVDKKPQTTAALILADPDYNLTPAEVTAAVPKQPSILEGPLVAQTRGVSDELRGIGRVKRLPGTAAEGKQAFDQLKTLTGREPRFYQQGEASETIVKATKSPQALVLATHGFFLKTQEVDPKTDVPSGLETGEKKLPAVVKDKDGKEVENPLLRCGLLLAGANKRANAKDGEDDGILTGLEIVGLDLRGTQMVVLSACETGVGEVQTGEGVAGLRQAFQLAGAESVLATLWQISDRATSQLMSTFYDELAKGAERSEALTRAQRQFIKERRERSGAAHPFFWASFTLTGN